MNARAQTVDRAPLERATITVKSVVHNGPGKPSVIKDTAGLSFGIWPDKAGAVQAGSTYEIEFDMNGSYRNIKTVRASDRPGPAPEQFTGGQRQAAPPPPAHREGNGGGNYRPTAPRDARRMFLCSQLNALITSHQVQPTSQAIADAIMMLSDAYDATIGREDQ
jgi:hypothetical protein